MAKVIYKDNTQQYLQKVQSNMKAAAQDIKNDLVNSARSAAPHKKGDLEKGINGKLISNGLNFKITVGAVAIGSKGYNYAEKMHNSAYNLGPQSAAKAFGESGMSGKSYAVGQYFISNPLEGNFNSYTEHLQKALKKSEI